ncbi:membrane metalloprotease [Flavobacterium sp. 14A]|uniref:membrane metalloprotease n=1 Tax=Flavobacterium sp. 14A TaxID=2735896 RepID=UPI0020C6280F|nr:membrane metalloprotease [Flavobacterium sp. 14A]NRT12129.1 hypothetical protein [Flavobacterium sp. 14A]
MKLRMMKASKVISALFLLAVLGTACSKTDDTSEEATALVTVNNKKVTGSSSRDLLSDAKFKSMVVELVYVKGFEPSAAAVANFVSFIEARTFKPGGITVLKREIESPAKTVYTTTDIAAIEDANRTKFNNGTEIAVWAYFSDGASAENEGNSVVLGIAYRNTSFVIFENTIRRNTSSNPFSNTRSLLEATVMEHEFGHILGLTNLGAPLQSNHEDPDNSKHCVVESCLMYFSSEMQVGIGAMAAAGAVPQLDAQCLADLRANGGR